MDLSFAAQALAVAGLASASAERAAGVHPVAPAVDQEVARLKLSSMGIQIDALSDAQERYLRPFGRIH
jgi:adenosylhomocysteinase